jgi:hypothetical protein
MAIVHHTLAESPAATIAPPDVKVEKGEQSKLMVYEMPKVLTPPKPLLLIFHATNIWSAR